MTGRKGLNLMSALSAQLHDARKSGLSNLSEAVTNLCIAIDTRSISTLSENC